MDLKLYALPLGVKRGREKMPGLSPTPKWGPPLTLLPSHLDPWLHCLLQNKVGTVPSAISNNVIC